MNDEELLYFRKYAKYILDGIRSDLLEIQNDAYWYKRVKNKKAYDIKLIEKIKDIREIFDDMFECSEKVE